jgi:AraC-like DNA-binding protein
MTRHEPIDPGLRTDPHAPDVVRLRQAVRATFRAVKGEMPAILRVEAGCKVIRGPRTVEVPAGSLVLLPAHLPLEVENHPAPHGPYRATALLVADRIPTPSGTSSRDRTDDPRVLSAFDRALDLLRRPAVPQAIRDHAILEILLWLDGLGLRLPPPGPPPLADRIRALAGADLSRDWTAADFCRSLGLAEATLRRHLASEGTNLSALLSDLRMTRALGLVQGSDLPLARIAHEVGYASASRFSVRFRARFGVAPRQIRGGDRPGSGIDRPGTVSTESIR